MGDDNDRWALLDAAPDATLVVDRAGQIIYATSRTSEMLGWSPADLIGRSISLLIPTELHERHQGHTAGFHESPKSRMMGAGLVLEAVRRGDSRVPVEIALSPHDVDGEPVVIASIRDISERMRLQDELNATASRLAVVDDRDRIARDLHDLVIQRLFASGLHLQAAMGRPDQDARITGVIDEIDEAIKEIRTTIFTMHSPRGISAGCEPALRVAVNEASRVLGHHPTVVVQGPTAVVGDELVEDMVSAARELLTNVAKHANASETAVLLEVADDTLRLTVRDNGVGIGIGANVLGGTTGGHGVRNLLDRAHRRGGHATFEPAPGGGTIATWSVPIA